MAPNAVYVVVSGPPRKREIEEVEMRRLSSSAALVFLMLVMGAPPASADVATYRVDGTVRTQVAFLPPSSLAIHGVGLVAPIGMVTAESTQTSPATL